MTYEDTVNQDTNGNDDNSSGEGQHQYSDTEKQLYARLKKEEALRKDLEAKIATKDGDNGQRTNISDNEWRERMEIRLEYGIKDDTELDFIMKNGGKEAFNNELVKIAIDKRKEDAVANEKVAMNVSSKSAIERKYSPQEFQAMSADEMEAVLTGRKR